jgi:signal-transduction protein with cAMP-binding, CBS, and nucleotidyltransferase domain
MEEIEEILKFLCSIHDLTPECLADLRRVIKKQEVRKDEVILKVGEINDKLYFIRSGIMHCYYYVGEKEVTSWFFTDGQFVVSVPSYYDRIPGEDCIAAFEDGILYYMMRDDYEKLCRTHHCFESLVRRQLQKYLVEFEAHPRFIRKHKADERIRIVRERLGPLFYRIPRNALASWLDMEPETFSRNQ